MKKIIILAIALIVACSNPVGPKANNSGLFKVTLVAPLVGGYGTNFSFPRVDPKGTLVFMGDRTVLSLTGSTFIVADIMTVDSSGPTKNVIELMEESLTVTKDTVWVP
jgi:hypothetical protein